MAKAAKDISLFHLTSKEGGLSQARSCKFRTANKIAGYLNFIRKPHQPYWETFVGAGWVLERIAGGKYASDANSYLIAMWQALQDGWIPPDNITEQEYLAIKDLVNDDDALKAFVGFGCSFGGKWFGGMAKNETDRNYCLNAKRSLLRKISAIGNSATFFHADFMTTDPMHPDMLIYCDPPYENTTGYGETGSFDNSKFWERVRQLSEQGHDVYVSEYVAPDDFSTVLEIVTKTDLRTVSGKELRIEKLFRYGQDRKFQLSMFDL